MKWKPIAALVIGLGLTFVSTSTAGAVRPGRPGPALNVVAASQFDVTAITVTWSSPASDGGSPILYYVASTRNGTRGCIAYPNELTCVITRVPFIGKAYTVRVKAVNARGTGPPGTDKVYVCNDVTCSGH